MFPCERERFHVNIFSGTDGYKICSLTRLKRMVGCRDIIISSFGVGWSPGGAPKVCLLGLHAVFYVPTIMFRAYDSWFTSLDT